MSGEELRTIIREEVNVVYAQRFKEDLVEVRNAARATKADVAWRAALLILLGYTLGSGVVVVIVRVLPLIADFP